MYPRSLKLKWKLKQKITTTRQNTRDYHISKNVKKKKIANLITKMFSKTTKQDKTKPVGISNFRQKNLRKVPHKQTHPLVPT